MNKLIVNANTFKLTYGFVSNEETRFYLCGVSIEKHGAGVILVATDGHRLGAFHQEDGLLAWEGDDHAGTIVSLPQDGLKACTPAKRATFMHNWLIVEHDQLNGDAKAMIVNADTPAEAEENRNVPSYVAWQGYAHIIDGSFPDWRRFIPKAEHANKPVFATFDSKLIAPFVAVSASASSAVIAKEAKAPIAIAGEDPGSPLIVHTDRPDFLGVLMGVRGPGYSYPEWLSAPAPVKEAAA